MVRICAIIGCSNSSKRLDKWYAQLCEKHGLKFGSCICLPPFKLFTFPSDKKDPEKRKTWIKIVKRKSEDGSNWQAKFYDRICSVHFKEGDPTPAWPDPTERLGYEHKSVSKPQRKPPKVRPPIQDVIKAKRKRKIDVLAPSTSVEVEEEHQIDVEENIFTESPTKKVCPSNAVNDHDYCASHGFSTTTSCAGCKDKEVHIKKIEGQVEKLKRKLKIQKAKSKQGNTAFNIHRMILKSDSTVNRYTGIENKDKLEALHGYLEPKVHRMRYWKGVKIGTSPRCTPKRKPNSTPKKPGPARLLNSMEEFILVLLKLRLALTIGFLASLFSVSTSTASHIFNTWVKFLAQELKHLVVWPDQIHTRTLIPKSLKAKYKNLRCTIDCTEVFIERPRNLLNQAATWSDYKHHNTAKFLVAIAPNGSISFLSKAWGGRATDVHITRESGFLKLIDPGDVILGDRGFVIKEDLLLRHAILYIPPPSKGKEQQTPMAVAKTKQIANARIHVERAIGRMKWFAILKETIPVTLVPLIDDIIVVCAALVNLRRPLVK